MADSSATIIDAPTLIGTVVGERYSVERLLGEGSMGLVFLAEHTHMKKKVALKVMKAEFLANPEAVERFKREAQAAGHIEHPHVCAATDFGKLDDDRYFLVMEYLEGRTLGDLLDQERRLEPSRAVKITRQISSGLLRAHELDVIHRDLKPDNVLLIEREADPEFVKITDFGVARVEVVDAQNLTRAGTTMGTPVYMSPEQAVAKRADARSDLYTLGIMMFEMLTGEVPFYSESLAVILSKHASEPAPPMNEVAPDALIPSDLCDIVDRLLHKRPEERFQSAAELIDALDAADLSPFVPGLPPRPVDETPESLLAELGAPDADHGVSGSDAFASGEIVIPVSEASETPVPVVLPSPSRPTSSARGKTFSDVVRGASPAMKGALMTAALAVLVLPVVVLAMIFTGGDDAGEDHGGEMAFAEADVAPQDLRGEQKDFLDDHDLEEKFATLAPADAVKALEPLLAENGANAHLRYLLATSRSDAGQGAQAMEDYAAAVAADPRYASDPRVLSDARKLFADNADDVANHAKPLMAALLASPNAPAAEGTLFEIGIDGPWNARKRSRDLLREAGKWDGLAPWQRDAIELGLVGKSACKKGQALVKSLEKSGDPAALPALRKAARRPKDGCGFLKKGDCYQCMRDDIARAIKTLERAEATPPPGEPTGEPTAPEDQ